MAPAQAARRSTGYRAAVAGRVVLAVIGGYGMAALFTALFSLALPLARSEAVAGATLASFAVIVAAVVVVFAARSLVVAALRIGAACLVLGGGFLLARAVVS